MRSHILFICLSLFFSCNEVKKTISVKLKDELRISKVEIQTFLEDSLLNVRALDITEGKVIAAASNGKIYGLFDDGETFGEYDFENVEGANIDSLVPNNFRAVAQIKPFKNSIIHIPIAVSIESPAKVFEHGTLVYQENHPKAFYDSMDFWNNKEGIAIGDPTDNCMSIIITRNSGKTWHKLLCDDLPKIIDGEAAFAASDTNIAIVGDKTWIATGGKASRILYSPDKGKTWQVFNTPIIQGKSTTGMYSLDFYDTKNGFAVGGDYTDADGNINNKIKTLDGGKTWTVIANGKNPGYRSCVQYVPNSNAKKLVAVGFKGIDFSNDAGETWRHLSNEGFYTIRFLNDSVAYAGGKGRLSKSTFK